MKHGIEHVPGDVCNEVWLYCDEIRCAGVVSWLWRPIITYKHDGCAGLEVGPTCCLCVQCNRDLNGKYGSAPVLLVDYSDPDLVEKVRAKLARSRSKRVVKRTGRYW